MDEDAVNLITEEAQPPAAAKIDDLVPATSTEPTIQPGSTENEQGKEDSMNASSIQNMQNMMNMNPMLSGMDMGQMMQMMAANGMNMNGFNPMMGESKTRPT